MKTIIIYADKEKTVADVILTYDAKVKPGELSEFIYMLLEAACEMDGFKLKHDLCEITEEAEAA